MSQPVELWFDFASTYSYVAALRLEDEAVRRGVELVYRPFLLGPLFTEQLGLKDSPFNAQPIRGRYMWRDVERLCAQYGLPWRRPSVFPRNSVRAARIACLAAGEPWGPPFIRAVFQANFAEDREIADPAVLAELLRGVGQAPDEVMARAEAEPWRGQLRENTAQASRSGLFGAPSLLVHGELYFGQDRLLEALAAATADAGFAPFAGATAASAREFASRWLPAWTGNDPERLVSFYADDARYLDPAVPQGVEGREALLAYFRRLLRRYPAWVWTQTEAIPMDGGFVNKWRAVVPEDGRQTVLDGVCLVWLRGGKIVRNEVYFDRHDWLSAGR